MIDIEIILLSVPLSIGTTILTFIFLEKLKSMSAGPKLVLLKPTIDWKYEGSVNIWLTNLGNVTTTFQGTIDVFDGIDIISEHYFNESSYRCSYTSATKDNPEDTVPIELSGPITPGETIKIPLAVENIKYIDIDIIYYKKNKLKFVSKSYYYDEDSFEMLPSGEKLASQKYDDIFNKAKETNSK